MPACRTTTTSTTSTTSSAELMLRESPCRWGITEPPSEPLLRWKVAQLRRQMSEQLMWIEQDIVREVQDVLPWKDPFAVLALVPPGPSAPFRRVIVANAILAASHAEGLSRRALRQVEFLATACPGVAAGAGWLRRLDPRPTFPTDSLFAAVEIRTALESAVEDRAVAV